MKTARFTYSNNKLENAKKRASIFDRALFFIVCLSFIRPGCFNSLADVYPDTQYVFANNVLEATCLLISVGIVIWCCFKIVWRIRDTVLFILLITLIISEFLNAQNGATFSTNIILRYFEYFAFALFVMHYAKGSLKTFIKVSFVFATFYLFLSLCSIYLTSFQGFIVGLSIEQRIFVFGTKNGFFNVAFLFLFTLVLYWWSNSKSINFPLLATLGLLFAATAKLIDSSNSTIMMLVFAALCVIVGFRKSGFGFLNIKVFLIILFSTILIICVLGYSSGLISEFLSLLGRNASFTGRNVIWDYAVHLIGIHPLIGNGNNITYDVSQYYLVNHAHCFYLDALAKHGVLYAICFLADILLYLDNRASRKNLVLHILLLLVFVFLFHAAFDDLNFFIYIFASRTLYLTCETTLESQNSGGEVNESNDTRCERFRGSSVPNGEYTIAS